MKPELKIVGSVKELWICPECGGIWLEPTECDHANPWPMVNWEKEKKD